MTTDEVFARLRREGHKLTPQRAAIVEAVVQSHGCLTPAALHQKAQQIDPGVGLVTVYRTLEVLSDMGLICEVHLADSTHGYVSRPQEHHDHLICSQCGKVVDFMNCNMSELESRLAGETGFAIDRHHLELYGRCRECQGHIEDKQQADPGARRGRSCSRRRRVVWDRDHTEAGTGHSL